MDKQGATRVRGPQVPDPDRGQGSCPGTILRPRHCDRQRDDQGEWAQPFCLWRDSQPLTLPLHLSTANLTIVTISSLFLQNMEHFGYNLGKSQSPDGLILV